MRPPSVLTAIAPRVGDTLAIRGAWCRPGLRVLALAMIVALWPEGVPAHDPDTAGGLFRTHDAGATWLPINPGIFVSGALALAVSPLDPNHLLLGTDSGVWRSRNGGRDWEIEAPGTLIGPAFAAAFDVDGERALVACASTIFRSDGDRWRPIQTPGGAAPARALVPGSLPGQVYLAGRTGLYRSDDWGRSWVDVGRELRAEHVNGLTVPPWRPEELYVVAGGRLWASVDGARSWQPRLGALDGGGVEVVGSDPSGSGRLWAVVAGQLFRSEDHGQHWRPVGIPLPEGPAIARAVASRGDVILIATDRGVFRSSNAGERWEPPGEGLPAHLPAALLVRDSLRPATFYAGFALTPYEELQQRSPQGGRALTIAGIASLAGGVALFALIALGGGAAVRRLVRTRPQARADRDV